MTDQYRVNLVRDLDAVAGQMVLLSYCIFAQMSIRQEWIQTVRS